MWTVAADEETVFEGRDQWEARRTYLEYARRCRAGECRYAGLFCDGEAVLEWQA